MVELFTPPRGPRRQANGIITARRRPADGQTAVFTVAHVDTVPKNNFPTSQVYGDTPDSELRLITCGGKLDQAVHSYESNVVVYANLTSVRET